MKYTVLFSGALFMQLITFFATKGGSGRTTAMMTTASGLIAAEHSVAVLDLTEQARPGWVFGPSFISQWEDRMVETGARANLVTAPAWDHESSAIALERFFRGGFNFVLVDSDKSPTATISSVINQSDLVIVPMRGPHEAAWSSSWFAANRYPRGRTYGLVTGASDRDDERLARATFIGAPMLNSSLPRLAALDGQMNTGMLHAKRRFTNGVPDDEQDECMLVNYDWIAAYTAADTLCAEIQCLLKGQIYPAYSVNRPLASGDTFAQLHAVLKQPSFS